jgi:soluble lytic murein transglycosylase-like protein
MQVMGAVAREFGYKKHFPELCGEDGIRIGCKLLRKLFEKYQDRYGNDGVIAAYNAGTPVLAYNKFTNQSYVNKVLAVFHG